MDNNFDNFDKFDTFNIFEDYDEFSIEDCNEEELDFYLQEMYKKYIEEIDDKD